MELINLTIDGRQVSVPKGTTVYHAAKQLGIDVPIFCYHDRMPPFGACRMCLVEVEKMPKLQTSCTLIAQEGMVVKTQSTNSIEGRESILELLLINHPLDCPICDRGGECPLQEHAFAHGPGKSRFYEEKRHFKKPIPLGPVLMLDRERCIICARCTRFSDVVAGDHALEFIDRGYKTEVGTPGGGPAESKFIGNTIMLCPVGALTSDVYRFRARPWDNYPTPSTCTLCPVGCSLYLDSRDGEIMRTRSRENKEVNDIWMCDKGWFGYEFTSHPDRLQQPYIRYSGKLKAATWDEALSLIASKMTEFKSGGKLAALGGNPLTTEENYLFQKLFRDVLEVNHIDHRLGNNLSSLDEEGSSPGMEISIGECEQLQFAALLGIDITEEFPVIWLRLKQAINQGAKVLYSGYYAPEIAPHLSQVLTHSPGKEIENINKLSNFFSQFKQGKGAIFVGSQYLNSPARLNILSELKKLRASFPNLSINIMEGQENSLGARFAGMRPDLKPLGKKIESPGFNALQVFEKAANNGWDLLYVAGANPAVKMPSDLWQKTRQQLKFLIVQDLFLTDTARQADVVLPALSFIEKGGNFLNIEGRVQPLLPGKAVPDALYSDGEIFIKIAENLNTTLEIDGNFSNKLKPDTKVYSRSENNVTNPPTIPSQNTNELHAVFATVLFDRGERMKRNTKLGKMAKEPKARIHPSEALKRGFNDNDRVQIKANGKTITTKLKFDDGVAQGIIVIPLGFDQVPVYELSPTLQNGLVVELV